MPKKWKHVWELIDTMYSSGGGRLDGVDHKYLKSLCYAPNISYRSWIFKYKGVLVALDDAGNGYWEFTSVVSRWDLFVAKVIETWHRVKEFIRN